MRSLVCLFVGFVIFAGCGRVSGDDKKTNVLLILSDDHNYRALGSSGNEVIRTPHLDQLAGEGVYFSRCFTPNPICTPSRACIFTGQDSWTNGVIFNGKAISEESPLLPKLLADAGYETAFIGKWHSDGKPWTRGYTTGGRCWAGGNFDHLEMDVTPFGGGPEDRVRADRYSTTLFTDDAVAYLEKEHQKPFCLVLPYTVAHDDFLAPPGYEGKYSAEEIPLPPNFMTKPPFEQFNPVIRDERELPFPRVEKDILAATAEYYAMIEHMDAQIGRMLEVLKRKKIDQDTIVIFCSVKGLSMGSHGIIGKQTMYEEGLRTNLIVRFPRMVAVESPVSELVSTTDLLPTICEAAGVDIPESVEGESLLGHYQGKGTGRDRLFFSYHDPTRSTVTRAIRTKQHKLIHHLVTGERQLFDLVNDPIEMENLIGKPEHKSIEKDLTKQLKEWREKGPEGK